MSTINVAVLVGSLRSGSIARKIANEMIAVAPGTLDCSNAEIGDLPHYNEDTDVGDYQPYAAFRERMSAAHAVLFVSPEYNRSIPGALKNAIDVGSRPYGRGSMLGKPAGIVTHAGGALGGAACNHALRQAVVFINMATMQQPEAYIGMSKTLFDESGTLVKEDTGVFLRKYMGAFADWARRQTEPMAA